MKLIRKIYILENLYVYGTKSSVNWIESKKMNKKFIATCSSHSKLHWLIKNTPNPTLCSYITQDDTWLL